MIPLHVLTGFLGAGKTTLLSVLLQAPRSESIAVLVNEVGELALDHHLLERLDEDVTALPSGCICCSMRGEMLDAVRRVAALRPARIVLETTGVADPAPILHGLTRDPRLAQLLQPAGVIAVVDASRIAQLLDTQPEVRLQLELADRVVLAKGDLAGDRLAAARALVAAAAPGCEVREAVHGHVDADWLLEAAPLQRLRDAGAARAWLHHEAGTPDVRTHAVRVPGTARIDLVQHWLRMVTQLDGHRLLRVKGLVECAASGEVFALQSAGHAVSPPRQLGRRPAGVHGVQMVLIERGLPDAVVQQAIAALHEAVAATPTR